MSLIYSRKFFLPQTTGLIPVHHVVHAKYMLSAMGFYPVDPVSAEYVFGAPQLPKMTLHLADGKTFTIIAENLSKEHKYVDSITLNGEPYTKKTISHEDIVKGGILVYKMK